MDEAEEAIVTAKRILTALLLAFVAASVAMLVVREARPVARPTKSGEATPANGVVVNYFHRAQRCVSCRKIEAAAREAVEKGFPTELKDGRLEWRVANYEAPGNEHLEKDYNIAASTIVVVEFRDGKQVRYKNCEEVWEHFDDPPALAKLVQGTVASFLGDGAAALTADGPRPPASGRPTAARGLLLAAAWAFWLGILTSISPCPLATNIAAVSFVGRRVSSSRQVLLSGLLYTLGRTLVYVALAALIVGGLLYKAEVAAFIARYLSRFLGPILVLVGMVLLTLIQFRMTTFSPGEKTQRRVEALGLWGAGLLGILFAVAFCPISAGLFFLSLIPLALEQGSRVLLPLVYGVGTALPVIVFAFVLAWSAQSLGKVFHRLTQFEFWARRATGAIFVLVGVYFCAVYIFGIV